jgi:hypothetical protein
MLSYLYQYAFGGIVFSIGLAMAWRSGEIGLGSRKQRLRLLVLLGGLGFFALLQGILQWGPR